MDNFNWIISVSRRVRLGLLALLIVLTVKTIAAALMTAGPPSASVHMSADIQSPAKELITGGE